MAAATVAPPPAPPARASGRKIERCKRESLGRTPAALPRASGRLTILPTIPADTRAPPARQAGFMAAATVAPPPAPLARALGRKIERCRHGSRGRTPAVSDRRRGQRFFAKEARGIVKRDGKGAAAQGETGAAAGRTEWESGRAPGMEERMMAGPGGGNGENGRESGRVRTGQDEEESGRAWRGACRGRGNGAMTRGKRACARVGQAGGSVGRCGRWMNARGRRTNGEERRPVGRKRRVPALQNDPAGVRKKSALLLYKTTRRACAKNAPLLYKTTQRACAKIARPCFTKAARRACAKKAHSCFTKRPGGRAQKSALLLCKRTQRACAKIARHCFAKRPGGRAQKKRTPALQNDPAGARKKAHSCFAKGPSGRAQK